MYIFLCEREGLMRMGSEHATAITVWESGSAININIFQFIPFGRLWRDETAQKGSAGETINDML